MTNYALAKNPHLVSTAGKFRSNDARTKPNHSAPIGDVAKRKLPELVGRLAELQRVLYADNRFAVLAIFQALDAAGKDGTIRAVFSGVDPTGCEVHAFKRPSEQELEHDFLWRTAVRLPERGRIGVFNRSYYEEVLAVRVHPEFLTAQHLPPHAKLPALWDERLESIRTHEEHLARNGIVVVKFWLNVSKEEQRKRLLERIEDPDANWKFEIGDVEERKYYAAYQGAYEAALRRTSRPHAPWYAIPADDKGYMRYAVAKILIDTIERLPLGFPKVDAKRHRELQRMRRALQA